MSQPPPQNYYPPPPPPPPPPPAPHPWPPCPPMSTGAYLQVQPQAMSDGSWSTGLFDCFSDITNGCITLVFPCITFGQIAEIVDRGSSSCGMSGALYTLLALATGCQCIYSCFYRSKMRAEYGLKDEPCPDLIIHGCFCELCSLCQIYRELNNRGFDPRIGWHANVERHGQLSAYPPPHQYMSR